MVPDVVEDEVVAFLTLGEVLPGVVDDMVSADRSDHVDVLRAAHACHLGTERFGDLHRERSEASRRAVDQNLVTWLDLPLVAKQLQCRGCGDPDRGCLLEREAGRLWHEVVRRGARVLGKGARAPAENLIAWAQLRHARTDGLHRPGDIRSRDSVLYLAQSVRRARDV